MYKLVRNCFSSPAVILMLAIGMIILLL